MEWSGIYYDGERAKSWQVRVSLDGDILQICDDNHTALAQWSIDEIRLVSNVEKDGVVHLRRGLGENERLNVADLKILAVLEAKCPNLHRTAISWKTNVWSIAIWITVTIVSLGLLVKIVIPSLSGSLAAIIPTSWERQIGERTADQIIFALSQLEGVSSSGRTCKDAVAQIALETFIERLELGDGELPYINLRVVDLKSVNALALPGGQILVFNGLLEFVENGDELSGVLAHEIAHVVLRHPLEVAIKGASLSVLISLVVGDITGGVAITTLGTTLVRAAYGRKAEQEADALAIRMLNSTGLESLKMADLFERFGRELPELEGALTYLSNHPLSGERAKYIRTYGRVGQPAFAPDVWKLIHSMCG